MKKCMIVLAVLLSGCNDNNSIDNKSVGPHCITLKNAIVAEMRTEVREFGSGNSTYGKTVYLIRIAGQEKIFLVEAGTSAVVPFLNIGDVLTSLSYEPNNGIEVKVVSVVHNLGVPK